MLPPRRQLLPLRTPASTSSDKAQFGGPSSAGVARAFDGRRGQRLVIAAESVAQQGLGRMHHVHPDPLAELGRCLEHVVDQQLGRLLVDRGPRPDMLPASESARSARPSRRRPSGSRRPSRALAARSPLYASNVARLARASGSRLSAPAPRTVSRKRRVSTSHWTSSHRSTATTAASQAARTASSRVRSSSPNARTAAWNTGAAGGVTVGVQHSQPVEQGVGLGSGPGRTAPHPHRGSATSRHRRARRRREASGEHRRGHRVQVRRTGQQGPAVRVGGRRRAAPAGPRCRGSSCTRPAPQELDHRSAVLVEWGRLGGRQQRRLPRRTMPAVAFARPASSSRRARRDRIRCQRRR